ncbi:putative protein kinase [Capsicum annuum]|uniref:Uncharacterized protein n=1 Tax=Capsicum annuum TaxID=4072 RepID=A0A1U8HKD4_CAPAN|nr:MAR-binding filament-like protein 1-1 [Capsicum annuum]KAF3624721.1 putative protein kinase [Capsicum annuum]KAF3671385.1 putative protein kinase [Capsicum annuum]PHT73993.1 hypothetical protein T459_21270 [Capsicum annuum]
MRLVLMTAHRGRGPSSRILRSVLDNRKSNINRNEATEPARVLLERLFAQTQKLEQQIGRNPYLPQVAELGLNIGKLESDIQDALAALKKEEDIQDTERKVSMEYNELNHAKLELEQRAEEIASASSRQEKLENENLTLASQAEEIEDLKFHLNVMDQEISAAQTALYSKTDEINKLKNELKIKSDEAANTESELRTTAELLDKANELVQRQEVELQNLRIEIQEKEKELEVFSTMQQTDEEKLKVSKSNLAKHAMDWLVAKKEMKKLEEETSKYGGEASRSVEEFRGVKKLLADVRSELVLSQRALASSREKMEEQENQLEECLQELEEQRRSVMSYMTSLKEVQNEVETEKVKLTVAEARNKELERDLSIEKELVDKLQNELTIKKPSLQAAMIEKSALQEELYRKSTEFGETQNLLQVKESELVDARLMIRHLKSECSSLQLMLEEKDKELLDSRKTLEELNQEIDELRVLVSSQELQLIQATSVLKEKEESMQIIQLELNDAKMKYSEAETVVEHIVDLTNKLVIDMLSTLSHVDGMWPSQLVGKPTDPFRWQKNQLNELELTRESLRSRERDVLAAQRAVKLKGQELKMVHQKLIAKEEEINKMKEKTRDRDDLKQLNALAKERTGEKSIGDPAIEKLQLKKTQLEVNAATSALQKLVELSRDLLNKGILTIESDYDNSLLLVAHSEAAVNVTSSVQYLAKVHTEMARLSAMTEKLVKEAGSLCPQ